MKKPLLLIVLSTFVFAACEPDVRMENFPKDPAFKVATLTAEIPGGTGGISVDEDGNIYIGDFGESLDDPGEMGNKVFKVTPDGEFSEFANDFQMASGNEFDSKHNFFQSSVAGNFITKISPLGEKSRLISEGLSNPVGIATDNQDNLYVCNCGGGYISKITPKGEMSQFVKSRLLKCPNGITRDPQGNFYVANFYNGAVVKITPDGKAENLVKLPGNNNGHLLYYDNFLYVVARSAHQIYKVSLEGKAALFAGSGEKGLTDGEALKASFCYPNDIGISPDGQYLYVNDVADISSEGRKLAPMVVRKIWMRKRAE